MGNLVKLILDGVISVEDLADAPELIERAALVKEAVAACQKTISFPLGKDEVFCYDYTDRAGEYSAWGTVYHNGVFVCECNWGGNHEIGRVDLTSSTELFKALGDEAFSYDLERFLREQIEKAKKTF